MFWYNLSKDGTKSADSPSSTIYKYEWRHPNVDPPVVEVPVPSIDLGEAVFVKPPGARCTSRWGIGHVTKSGTTRNTVEVDNIPRHILDVRRVSDRSEPRCTSRWRKGLASEAGVTGNAAEIDSVPNQYILDTSSESESSGSEEEEEEEQQQQEEVGEGEEVEVRGDEPPCALRRSERVRKPPFWVKDFET